jgi:hypothetical protein
MRQGGGLPEENYNEGEKVNRREGERGSGSGKPEVGLRKGDEGGKAGRGKTSEVLTNKIKNAYDTQK